MKKSVCCLMFLTALLSASLIPAGDAVDLVDASGINMKEKKRGSWSAIPASLCKRTVPNVGDKSECLLIEVPEKHLAGSVLWQYNSPYNKSYGAGLIEISCLIKTENVTSLLPEYTWAYPYVSLIGHEEENGQLKNKNFTGVVCGKKDNWTEYKIKYTVNANVIDLAVVFALNKCTGKMWIANFSMKFTPVSEKEKAEMIKVLIRNKETNLINSPRRELPEIPLQTVSQKHLDDGYILYHRKNPRNTYADSVPTTEEIDCKMEIFATPGEFEPSWLAVYALKDLKNLKVNISDLRNENGNVIKRENIQTFTVRCWPQGNTRSAEGHDNTYYIIPELLIEKKQIDIPSKSSQNFYFLVKVPEKTQAGIYKAEVQITSENGKSLTSGLTLRVLPFKLKKPSSEKMIWFIHTGGNFSALCSKNTDETAAITTVLRDMKDHGISGISIGCNYGKTLVLSRENDQLKIKQFPKIEKLLPAMKQAGMQTAILRLGDLPEYQTAKLMNFELPQIGEKGGVSKAMLAPEFESAYVKALLATDKFIKELTGNDFQWYFMGIDEPGGFITRHDRALWEYRLAKSAGLKGAAFMHGPFWKKLAPYNNITIFNAIDYKEEDTAALIEELKKHENIPYQYGASGTYDSEPGGLMPSRWGTGFFAWKTKIQGQISWLYELSSITDINTTKHMSFYPLITYVIEGKLTGTLQWEGIREGIDDYCYLYTLSELIASAKQDTAKSKHAVNIEKNLEKLLESVPWNNLGKNPLFNNDTASKFRWQIAIWIMELTQKE